MAENTNSGWKGFWIFLAVVVVLAAIGVTVWYFTKPKSAAASDSVSRTSNSSAAAGTDTAAQAERLFDEVQQRDASSLADAGYSLSGDYDARANLPAENPNMVPAYQAALKNLPAMQSAHLQEAFAGNNIGASAREGIDGSTTVTFDSDSFGDGEDYDARVRQTKGVGIGSIYAKGDGLGMSLINQKSRMVDPAKMLPRATPGQESERLVQVGPSIAEIGCRVPQAADLMRMLRASRGSAFSQQIPRDRPPVYTTGLNSVRSTRLPAQPSLDGCTLGVSPLEVSDLIDYTPNPFLHRSKAVEAPANYRV
jgi:hypothetical protein